MVKTQDLEKLQQSWNAWARKDPLYAVLTFPEMKGRKWSEEEFFETGKKEIDELLAWLEEIGFPLKLGRALDFGSGVGRLSRALALSFNEVYGVDISDEMVKLAKELNRKQSNCEFVLNISDSLEFFEASSFDLIYSNIVLQHMPAELAHRYILEFMRLVRPGGVVVFALPVHRINYPPARRFFDILKSTLRPALNQIGTVLFKEQLYPEMLMNCTSPEKIAELILSTGGTLIQARELDWGKPDWRINLYAVTKRKAPEAS